MTDLTPLRFQPILRSYLWGGRRLQTVLGKSLPPEGQWAESWELVQHGKDVSQISEGPLKGTGLGDLLSSRRAEILGENGSSGEFPLLLKYLDCNRVLSVQVHPDDQYGAQMTPPDLGKTEAWYVVQADPGAMIYAGLKPGVGRSELKAAIADGATEDCLNVLTPAAGDCIFIPAGTVHALGAGLVVAEIQQSSDTTFRLYDWNRTDQDGKPRPLHVEQALEVIRYEAQPVLPKVPVATAEPGRRCLVNCDKFVLDELIGELTGKSRFHIGGDGRCRLLTIPKGSGTLAWSGGEMTLNKAETVLVPAALSSVSLALNSNSVALDIRIPSAA